MLLILFFMHLLSKNSSAAPPSHPLHVRTSTDSCDDINNCRQLFDVVWGCLVTIFACTWVSVHPNVPPADQSWLALRWRRLKMTLFGIIAPEIMAGFADNSREPGCYRRNVDSPRHMVFLFAWAALSRRRDIPLRPKNNSIIKLSVEDIMDKSKGDVLSKGVALAQGLWFITQCVARVYLRLAVTEPEVATLGFAIVYIFIWLLWWDKPLDVQRPIVVGLHHLKLLCAEPRSPARIPRWGRFSNAVFGPDHAHEYCTSLNA
ncbi:hypothetical protein K438DRAFT_1748324 [Mycena galopus ATCC 62051]|nr:hypothetical protein K438DRAFT_1748324 [Mycena galopus ATCC 62051]